MGTKYANTLATRSALQMKLAEQNYKRKVGDSAATLPRIATWISLKQKNLKSTGAKRNLLNSVSKASLQCKSVLGEPIVQGEDAMNCWLCGFALEGLAQNKAVKMATPFLDEPVCEHVLPIKVAAGLLKIYQKNTYDPMYDSLIHTEYEYAHQFCNYVKGDTYFLTLPYYKGNTSQITDNYCDLQINGTKIYDVLKKLTTKTRSGLHDSTVVVQRTKYANPVQAYMALADMSDPEAWIQQRLERISRKMNGLIQYIKAFDGCSTPMTGRWFHGWDQRLVEVPPTTVPYMSSSLPRVGSYVLINRGKAASPTNTEMGTGMNINLNNHEPVRSYTAMNENLGGGRRQPRRRATRKRRA